MNDRTAQTARLSGLEQARSALLESIRHTEISLSGLRAALERVEALSQPTDGRYRTRKDGDRFLVIDTHSADERVHSSHGGPDGMEHALRMAHRLNRAAGRDAVGVPMECDKHGDIEAAAQEGAITEVRQLANGDRVLVDGKPATLIANGCERGGVASVSYVEIDGEEREVPTVSVRSLRAPSWVRGEPVVIRDHDGFGR